MRIFTDTEKWRDEWFHALSPGNKMLWYWMTDMCNVAGIFKWSPTIAAMEIGIKKLPDDPLAPFVDRIVHLRGDWYAIRKYIPFQQGCPLQAIGTTSGSHIKIRRLTEEYGGYDSFCSLLTEGTPGVDRGCTDPRPGIGISIGKVYVKSEEKPKFEAPTLAMVEEYMIGQMPAVAKRCPGAEKMVHPKQEAPLFVGYYTQREWKIKSKSMVSWQQSAYNWLVKSFQFKQEKTR